jgi:hypothetical protein
MYLSYVLLIMRGYIAEVVEHCTTILPTISGIYPWAKTPLSPGQWNRRNRGAW